MGDTVQTDIRRTLTIADEVLARNEWGYIKFERGYCKQSAPHYAMHLIANAQKRHPNEPVLTLYRVYIALGVPELNKPRAINKAARALQRIYQEGGSLYPLSDPEQRIFEQLAGYCIEEGHYRLALRMLDTANLYFPDHLGFARQRMVAERLMGDPAPEPLPPLRPDGISPSHLPRAIGRTTP